MFKFPTWTPQNWNVHFCIILLYCDQKSTAKKDMLVLTYQEIQRKVQQKNRKFVRNVLTECSSYCPTKTGIHNFWWSYYRIQKKNLLDLYNVSYLSKDRQLWKKRETNQESWSISDNVYIQYLTQSIIHSWKPFMCVSIF